MTVRKIEIFLNLLLLLLLLRDTITVIDYIVVVVVRSLLITFKIAVYRYHYCYDTQERVEALFSTIHIRLKNTNIFVRYLFIAGHRAYIIK